MIVIKKDLIFKKHNFVHKLLNENEHHLLNNIRLENKIFVCIRLDDTKDDLINELKKMIINCE